MSTTPVSTRRHIPLSACFNLRDLGGYAGHGGRVVRWGAVYRADGLHRLPPEECGELADLGIRTVVDLRTPAELETAPSFCYDGIEVVHLPVLRETWGPAGTTVGEDDDPVEFLGARYMEMAEEGAAAIAATLQFIAAEARRPLVFHCAAGKDRTGVVAALLLSILGVSDDHIAADYHLSAQAMARLVDWIRANRPEAAEVMARQPSAMLDCPTEVIHEFLFALRFRHGSTDSYLDGIGVGADVRLALRAGLLTA